MNQKSYEGSHVLLSGIEIVAWLSSVSAIVMAVLSVGNPQAALSPVGWLALSFGSLGLAAVSRVGRAILNIAENTATSAQLISGFVETQASGGSREKIMGGAAATELAPAVAKWPMGQIEVYRGYVITGMPNRVFANDRLFDSVEEARIHLNSVPAKHD